MNEAKNKILSVGGCPIWKSTEPNAKSHPLSNAPLTT